MACEKEEGPFTVYEIEMGYCFATFEVNGNEGICLLLHSLDNKELKFKRFNSTLEACYQKGKKKLAMEFAEKELLFVLDKKTGDEMKELPFERAAKEMCNGNLNYFLNSKCTNPSLQLTNKPKFQISGNSQRAGSSNFRHPSSRSPLLNYLQPRQPSKSVAPRKKSPIVYTKHENREKSQPKSPETLKSSTIQRQLKSDCGATSQSGGSNGVKIQRQTLVLREKALESNSPIKLYQSDDDSLQLEDDLGFLHGGKNASEETEIDLLDDDEDYIQEDNDNSNSRGGFKNLGNTCYMNSVMEAFSSIECFRSDLCNISILSLLPEDGLYISFQKIMQERIANQKRILDLSTVKEAVSNANEIFKGTSQQDAHEFICACFLQLEAELVPFLMPSKEGKSILSSEVPTTNFCGELLYAFQCSSCSHEVLAKENFYFLSIPLDTEDTRTLTPQEKLPLDTLVSDYFKPEDIEMKCSTCEHGKATRKPYFSVLPRVLIIQLQRFRYNLKTDRLIKYHEKIIPSPTLRLDSFCREQTQNPLWPPKEYKVSQRRIFEGQTPPCKMHKTNSGVAFAQQLDIKGGRLLSEEQIEPVYNLRAVISHHGSATCGHYTCDVFHEDDTCEHCNDSIISSVTREEGEKAAEDGYLFFYVHNNLPSQKSNKQSP